MCRKLIILTSFVLVLALAGTNVVKGDIVIERQIAGDNDDGEDHIAYAGQTDDGAESRGSSDLEMPWESGTGSSSYQVIGLRFLDIPLEKGEEITAAYVQFTGDDER